MNLTLRDVNSKNIKAIKQLKVHENQINDIETNEESINESIETPLWKPTGIYDNTILIGFTMFGEWIYEDHSKRVWLDRIMIDKSNQNKGYGKTSVKLIIAHLFTIYRCSEIYLSVYESNTIARNLYESLNFMYNGEIDTKGELVMVLKLIKEDGISII